MATTQQHEATLQELAQRHLWLHFSRMGAYSDGGEIPIIVRGEGCHVWVEHGKKYFDGLSALFCVNIGHGRADVAQAGARQAEELGFYTNWSYAHPRAIELAERLKRRESFSNLLVQVNVGPTRRWWELSGTPMLDDKSNFLGFRGVGSDVTEQRESDEKIAYLFISHDLAVVGYLADHVAVVYLGRIMELGRTEQIFAPPSRTCAARTTTRSLRRSRRSRSGSSHPPHRGSSRTRSGSTLTARSSSTSPAWPPSSQTA